MNPVFSIGHEKQLDMKDVPELAPENSASRVFSSLKETLESQIRIDGIHGSDTSSRAGRDANAVTSLKLAKALFFLVKREILFSGLLHIIHTLTSYSGITGIRHFANEGYILGFAFIVLKLLECLMHRHVTLVLQRAHLKIRASVAMIYQKGLTLSSSSKQGSATGETVNIMSVNAANIGTHVFKVHDVWKAPAEVVLALLILYYTVGLAARTALAAAFITSIFISPFGMSASNFYKKIMDYKDARMKATSEILRNMRVLKFQAWEMKFLTKITDLREKEEIWLKKSFYVGVIFHAVSMGSPTFIATVTFTTCIFVGIPLELANVLSALATINHLQQPMINLFGIILDILQIKVSFDRITSYISLAGLQEGIVQKLPRGSSEVAIEVSNETFSWDLSSDTPTMTDLNIRVLQGNRVAICGAVGSGKSSLLSSILGEVPKVSGAVKLCGTVAYVAQSPWIQRWNSGQHTLRIDNKSGEV